MMNNKEGTDDDYSICELQCIYEYQILRWYTLRLDCGKVEEELLSKYNSN